jgi:hypothetical protein
MGPRIEAWIWERWRCVPGPGMYLVAAPRGWPGMAMEVGVVAIVGICLWECCEGLW